MIKRLYATGAAVYFVDGEWVPLFAGGADNTTLNTGTGGDVIATDDVGGVKYQRVKVTYGADGAAADVTGSVGLPTDMLDRAARDCGKIDVAMGQAAHDAAGASIDPVAIGGYASAATPTAVTADGDICRVWLTTAGAVNVADGGTTLSIDDGGGAITVDGSVSLAAALPAGTNNIGDVDVLTLPALPTGTNNIGDVDVLTVPAPLSTTGGGTEATALRVTIANDSTGVVSVDDNGGSITVDGTVDTELPAAAALGDAVSNPTAPAVGAFLMGWDAAGVVWERVQTDASGSLNVAVTGTVAVGSAIPGTSATNLGKAEDAAHSSGDTGVYMLGVRDDSPAAHSGADGDYESIHVNAEGGVWMTPTPSAGGGLSIFRSLDLDETEEDVKTSAGQVYGLWFTNTATSTRWLKFYNATAATVVVGTTTPVLTLGLPGNTSDDISGVFDSTHGIAFSTAICVAATTGVADNDTGAPSANDVIVNIFYK